MGCLLSKRFFKNDEVSPISIRPRNMGAKMDPNANGITPKPGVLTRETRVHAHENTVWANKTVSSTSHNATNGSTNRNSGTNSLTDQKDASKSTAASENDATDRTSEKDSASPVTQNDFTVSTSETNAAELTNQNDDSLPTSNTDAAVLTNDKDAITPASENDATIPMGENDVFSVTEQEPAAEEMPMAFQMPEVSIEKVPDGEGCPITLGKLFGVWTAPWPSLPQQIMRAQAFTFDDSDVILTGYAKSGSHWMWEMLHMLLTGKAEHCRTPKERLMLSFSTQEFFDTLEPPRVFNCHAPFVGLPMALKERRNKCKIIHMLRNPKDLAVSFYHHLTNQVDFEYEGNFHGYLDLFLEGKLPGGSWFDYVLGWEQTWTDNPDLPILVLYYEDVKENTMAALQKVNEFLGLGRGEDLVREIADQCSITNMKKVDVELKEKDFINISKTGKNFILRKGQVGDWRNWFSEEDDRRFQQVVDNRLRHSQLHFRYSLQQEEDKEEGKEKREEKVEEKNGDNETEENDEEGLKDKENDEEGLKDKENDEEGLKDKEKDEEGLKDKEKDEEGLKDKEKDEEGLKDKEKDEEGLKDKEKDEEGLKDKEKDEEGLKDKENDEEGLKDKENDEEGLKDKEKDESTRL